MHSREVVAEVLRLRHEQGLGAVRVARRLGLPVATVRDWHAGKLPRHSRPMDPDAAASRQAAGHERCARCEHPEHDHASLPERYVYLLGLYLGDGSIAQHPRGVHKLRISLDRRYPRIVDECAAAMAGTLRASRVHRRLTLSNCWEVYSYSRSWPCLFPQHGRG